MVSLIIQLNRHKGNKKSVTDVLQKEREKKKNYINWIKWKCSWKPAPVLLTLGIYVFVPIENWRGIFLYVKRRSKWNLVLTNGQSSFLHKETFALIYFPQFFFRADFSSFLHIRSMNMKLFFFVCCKNQNGM